MYINRKSVNANALKLFCCILYFISIKSAAEIRGEEVLNSKNFRVNKLLNINYVNIKCQQLEVLVCYFFAYCSKATSLISSLFKSLFNIVYFYIVSTYILTLT